MTSPETTAARNRVTLATEELQRAQAALAFAQAAEYSDALQLIGSIVIDAGNKATGATLPDAKQILQTAIGNVVVVLQSAGIVQQPAPEQPAEGEQPDAGPDAEPAAA